MGVFYGTVRPIGLDCHMDALRAGLSSLPHDREGKVCLPGAGFGLLQQYSTPECPGSRSPRHLPHLNLLFCADGRLDYREDLCELLQLSTSLPDEELMLKAYLRWGKSIVHFLEGDWLLCAYDVEKKELFIARDKHGYTSLYYTHSHQELSFCSTPRGILALPGFKAAINRDAFVAKLLSLRVPEANAHFLKDVMILHPAHTLTYKEGICKIAKFWHPENIQEDPAIPLQDGSQQLLHLLREAVRVRLRTYRPICTTLSGGLDSGTVATLAAGLLEETKIPLYSFSHVPQYGDLLPKSSGYLLDETAHIRATAKKSGNIFPTLLRSEGISPLEGVKRQFLDLFQVNHACGNAYWMADIIANSTGNGFGTVFTGEMGNATISFAGVPNLPPYPGSSLLQKLKARTKHAVLRSSPFIPFLGAVHWHKAYLKNSFLRKELFFEYERLIHDQREAHLPLYENALDAKLALLQVGSNPRCTLGGLKNVTYNLSYRDPSADARVIEYCLRLPNALYFDEKGKNKQVIRHAMKGILPDKVLFSNQKGRQSADLYYRLLHYGQETEALLAELSTSTLARLWMDVPKLDKEWQLLKREDPRAVNNCSQFFKNLSFAYYVLCQEKNL